MVLVVTFVFDVNLCPIASPELTSSPSQVALNVQDPNQPSLLQSILTPMDEVDFWAEMASRGGPGAKVAQQV